MTHTSVSIPGSFIWRRIHSLAGLWLALFLTEHLLTNSQAALLIGNDAKGFVRMVNFLHNLPHLQVVELVLIGVPLLIHLAWGVGYLFTARPNSIPWLKRLPSLPQYSRNHGYTWMRITAVIMGVGIVLHVIQFRFLNYPAILNQRGETFYFTRLSMDDDLYTLSKRLDFELYTGEQIREKKQQLEKSKSKESRKEERFLQEQEDAFLEALQKKPLDSHQIVAVSSNFGTATLLVVRNVFKSPLQVFLYSIFVLSTSFHAGHGFWTFLVTWGVILKPVAQDKFYRVAFAVALFFALLGLFAIWGIY